MMRAGIAGITLALLSTTAHAQFAVLDAANLANTTKSVASEAVAAAKRLEMINNQILQLVRLKQTFEAVSHGNLAAMANAVPELGALGLSNPLGDDMGNLAGAVAGSAQALGGLASTASATGNLAQGLLQADQFYAPQGGDFRAVQMLQAANALASQKAIAETALASNGQRLEALSALRRGLDGATDIKASTDATARLTGENAQATAQGNQLLALQILQRVQASTDEARELQAWRCSAEKLVMQANGAATAAGGGAVTLVSADTVMPSACQVRAPQAQPTAPQFQNVAYNSNFANCDTTGGTGGGGTDTGGMLGQMLVQPWGGNVAADATAMGVNSTALAATCMLESNCNNNVGGTGTISGAFQMTNAAYQEGINGALATNPDLASQITGKNDATSQGIAAAQYLRQGAQTLMAAGVSSPTTMDVRGYYQFGPSNAVNIASATDNQLMSTTLTNLSPAALAANNIGSSTTVGQWRQSVATKIGSAATQSVLLGISRT